MKKIIYFAVFEPTDTGYSVYFPDLPGCVTVGGDMAQAVKMAGRALGLHLWGMERDGEEIPAPTLPPFEDVEEGCFTVPVEIFPAIVKNDIENKAVKKTLTIPYWLNEIAEKEGVNFSQVLQVGLKEYLRISN